MFYYKPKMSLSKNSFYTSSTAWLVPCFISLLSFFPSSRTYLSLSLALSLSRSLFRCVLIQPGFYNWICSMSWWWLGAVGSALHVCERIFLNRFCCILIFISLKFTFIRLIITENGERRYSIEVSKCSPHSRCDGHVRQQSCRHPSTSYDPWWPLESLWCWTKASAWMAVSP